jgi:hypothetical protein
MRTQLLVGVVVFAIVSGHSPQLLADGREDAKAAAVMADARKALGGDAKLAGLKGLTLRAEFRRELSTMVQGGGSTFVMIGGGGSLAGGGAGAQVTGSLEIDLLFPDKF